MAKRLDTGSASQEEVEALFENHDLFPTENGEDESPVVDEESNEDEEEEEAPEEDEEAEGEEDEEEEEPEEEEEESEESDEDAEEEEESDPEQNLDWSKADKRLKAAYDAEQAKAQKWEKAHSKLQSQLTRESKSRQQEEGTLEELRSYAEEAKQWNLILDKHPALQQVLEAELAKINDPDSDVPDYLKADPVYQQMQRHNKALEQRLAQFEQRLEPVKDIQAERKQAQNRQKLDGLLSAADAQFKQMFGKSMGENEKTEVLKYMMENKYWESGKNVAVQVFSQQYEKALNTRKSEALKAKAKKFGSRNKSVSPARSKTVSQDAGSVEEAVARALADQGY